jgi:hypothetical protein
MQLPPPTPRPSIATINAIALAILVAPIAARADSADAEALFDQGNRLMAEASFAAACEAFEASTRAEPRAGTLIRLGDCREANHQLASAWAAYRDALARAVDPRKRDIATAKLAQLEPRLSRLTIEVPDDARLAGLAISRGGAPVEPELWNRPIPVDGGELVIAARAPGYAAWRTPVTLPEAGGAATITVPRLVEGPLREPVALPPPVPPVSVIKDEPSEPAPPRWTPVRKAALGVGGAGIASLAVSAVFAAQARSHADLWLGLGAGATATSVVLWFVGAPRDDTAIAVAPAVSATGTGLAVAGRF